MASASDTEPSMERSQSRQSSGSVLLKSQLRIHGNASITSSHRSMLALSRVLDVHSSSIQVAHSKSRWLQLLQWRMVSSEVWSSIFQIVTRLGNTSSTWPQATQRKSMMRPSRRSTSRSRQRLKVKTIHQVRKVDQTMTWTKKAWLKSRQLKRIGRVTKTKVCRRKDRSRPHRLLASATSASLDSFRRLSRNKVVSRQTATERTKSGSWKRKIGNEDRATPLKVTPNTPVGKGPNSE